MTNHGSLFAYTLWLFDWLFYCVRIFLYDCSVQSYSVVSILFLCSLSEILHFLKFIANSVRNGSQVASPIKFGENRCLWASPMAILYVGPVRNCPEWLLRWSSVRTVSSWASPGDRFRYSVSDFQMTVLFSVLFHVQWFIWFVWLQLYLLSNAYSFFLFIWFAGHK